MAMLRSGNSAKKWLLYSKYVRDALVDSIRIKWNLRIKLSMFVRSVQYLRICAFSLLLRARTVQICRSNGSITFENEKRFQALSNFDPTQSLKISS